MAGTIKVPVTLGHKVSESTDISVLKGVQHTMTFKRFAVLLDVDPDKYRDKVEVKCEFCNRILKLKVLTTKYYRLWRAVWLGILAVILGLILYFKYPYSKASYVFIGIFGIIILWLLFKRNPKPCVTWQENENRDEKHVVF